MNRVGLIKLVLLGFIILSGAAQAEVFKWVDANGKVHYSDRKTSPQAQTLNIKTGAETIGHADQGVDERIMKQQKYVNFLQSERVDRKEKRQEAQKKEDKKHKLCAAMKNQLNGYGQGNYRWYELDEKTGERNFLSEDNIEAKKQQLQSELKSNCN